MCTAIDSAPGYHTDVRPVSLDPVWPEKGTQGKNFLEKWPVAKLSIKKRYATNVFYREEFCYWIKQG